MPGIQEEMKGVIVALVAPFDHEGGVVTENLGPHIEACLAEGVDGFWINGFSGLGIYLEAAERQALAECAVEKIAGRVPAWVHVGAMDTRRACQLAELAAGLDIAGISTVPPLVYNTTLDRVIDHLNAIQQAAERPLTYYHVPALTRVQLEADEFVVMSERVPHLAAIKFSDIDIFKAAVIRECAPHLRLLTGFEEVLLAGLAMGCFDGTVGAGQNFLPGPLVDVYRAFQQGDLERARHIHRGITRLLHIQGRFDFTAATYAFLNLLGFAVGVPRPPMQFLNPVECELVQELCLEVVAPAPFEEQRLIRTGDFLDFSQTL